MKIEDPLKGNCKHGITKKHLCKKCWDKMSKDNLKKTEKFLKDLNKFEKSSRKPKIIVGDDENYCRK